MTNVVKGRFGNGGGNGSGAASEPTYRLTIDLEGATPDQLSRGVAAAEAVFEEAGVTAEEAATAQSIVEGWDVDGFPEPAPNDALDILHVWDDASIAAMKACRPDWDEDTLTRNRNKLRLEWASSAAA